MNLSIGTRISYVTLILITVLLTVLVVSGCSQAPSAASTSSSAYQIVITQGEKQMAILTVADLKKLPQIKATVTGSDEQGPTLVSVLNSVGVKDFNQLTIYGYTKQRIATTEVTLLKSEVTESIILVLVQRGTAKLTGSDLSAQKNVIDVNKIAVK